MKDTLNYSVRIIQDSNELTKCLAMRFKIYSKTFPGAIHNHDSPFESDPFDCRSIHIGLYCENHSGNNLIGYSRFILPNIFVDQFQDHLIPNHNRYPLVSETSNNDNLHFEFDLPESYKSIINKYCSQLKQDRKVYIETSRFMIDDNHRSISVSSFFANALMSLAKVLNIDFAFFSCSIHHAPYYKRSGLSLFPNMEMYENQRFGTNFILFGTDLHTFYQKSFNIVLPASRTVNHAPIIKMNRAA